MAGPLTVLIISVLCVSVAVFALARCMPPIHVWHTSTVLAVFVFAAALNVLASPVRDIYLTNMVLIPAACFVIASLVAAISPSYGWLVGLMASPWYFLVSRLHLEIVSWPTGIDPGGFALDLLLFWLPWGLLGGVLGNGVAYMSRMPRPPGDAEPRD